MLVGKPNVTYFCGSFSGQVAQTVEQLGRFLPQLVIGSTPILPNLKEEKLMEMIKVKIYLS